MNIKVLAIIIVILIILSFIVLLIFGNKGHTTKPGQIPIASQSPSNTTNFGNSNALSVIKTIPDSGTQEIYPDQRLVVSFNKDLGGGAPAIQFTPNVLFNFQVLGKDLYIIPSQNLATSTQYTISLSGGGMASNYSFNFTTSSKSRPSDLTQSDPGAQTYQAEENFLLQNYPDSFLANKLPFSVASFSADISTPKSQSNPNYIFKVILKGDQQTSKNDFITWAKSLGLSDSQIQGLNINYVTSAQDTAVTSFKASLPYYSSIFAIKYDKSLDKTTVIIDQTKKQAGDQAFDAYLQKFGINDRTQVSNLMVLYQ